ncbi:organic cation transporter [Danaus plexippus plexippus]|uniref:Organic cation transporter n=1 Tax=Danaus plexippus plexippus TaxID=278856 RepID=A0A212FFR4_DANPL|nr:organic cation transporter [Danaus plexippus plexippus]
MELQRQGDENGSKSNQNEPKLDHIQSAIGSFGKYQFYLCFLIFLSKFPVAFHQMAIIFLAPKAEFTCEGTQIKGTCPCDKPVYDTSIFTNTIITQWDLICKDKWLASLTQTLFQLGTLIGSLLFGMASDRFGRKKPMLFAVLLQVSSGVAAAFAPDYWSFSLLRFIVGMSVGGTMVVGFVIIMEYVGAKYRDIISALYQAPFNMGHMLLPVFGYFFRDYVNFQLAISLPAILLLSYFFLLPETGRWLIATQRTEEAIQIIERVATINKRPTEHIRKDIETHQKQLENNKLKKGTLLDLFRTPNLRKNILAMSFNWLTCSYCFYGVSQYVGQSFSVFFASIGVVASFIVFVVVYLYCTELFPTVVRNAAIGFSSMMARIGSMIAPFVIDLRDTAVWLPPIIFAIFPLAAAMVSFLLPETKGHELMTTIEEGERFGKKEQK